MEPANDHIGLLVHRSLLVFRSCACHFVGGRPGVPVSSGLWTVSITWLYFMTLMGRIGELKAPNIALDTPVYLSIFNFSSNATGIEFLIVTPSKKNKQNSYPKVCTTKHQHQKFTCCTKTITKNGRNCLNMLRKFSFFTVLIWSRAIFGTPPRLSLHSNGMNCPDPDRFIV